MKTRYRIIISALTLLLAAAAAARTAGPAAQTPDRFTPDSARIINDAAARRTQRLYDSIQSKSSRKALPRALYRILFVRPARDTSDRGQVTDEAQALKPYAGKTIGSITVERHQVFDPGGNWLERAGNNLHVLTRDRVIRRDLFFKTGDTFDPELIVRNKQLLRSRSYIADVDVRVQPDAHDSTTVHLVIETRDSWTISADGALHAEGRTMVGVYDANIFGSGNRLKIMTNFNRNDFSYGGNMVEYEIPNFLGTFYQAGITAGRDFYNSTLDVGLQKEFLRPTDYEVGITYSNIREKIHMVETDTMELVRQRNFDLWGGYAHYLPGIESSLFLTGHFNRRRVGERPVVAEDLHPALHDQDVLLFSTGLYREKFYSANMFYGFGVREYLATGYKAELTSGYAWREFYDGVYLGASCQAGSFCPIGYLMGHFTLGSYIEPRNGMWHGSAIDIDLRWFSNLFIVRRSRIRQFLSLNYTQGWNRVRGNNESVYFNRANGLQMLNEYMLGTNRMVLNTETVLFTPYQPLGFRIALFGFADLGLIGYSPNIFKNNFVSTLGVGVRLRNERLVFNTVQIQLGVALGKNGLLACDYVNVSNYTRLEQYRYRPTRPEIVGFQ